MSIPGQAMVAPVVPPCQEALLVEIEKGQQLAGRFPDAEALDRARRVLQGSLTPEAAHAELAEKYRQG